MTAKIFLEIVSDVNNNNEVEVTIETYVTLFVCRFIRCEKNISIYLIRTPPKDNTSNITVDIGSIPFIVLDSNCPDFVKEEAALANFPVVENEKCIIAGLCGVCRALVKLVDDDKTKKLLGFKDGCLQGPSETSTWTKFCEIDFINCTKNVMRLNGQEFEGRKSFRLFDEFGIFEKHLALPVRIHNVYKVARNLAKETKPADEKLDQQFERLSLNYRDRVPRLNKQRKSKVSLNLDIEMVFRIDVFVSFRLIQSEYQAAHQSTS